MSTTAKHFVSFHDPATHVRSRFLFSLRASDLLTTNWWIDDHLSLLQSVFPVPSEAVSETDVDDQQVLFTSFMRFMTSFMVLWSPVYVMTCDNHNLKLLFSLCVFIWLLCRYFSGYSYCFQLIRSKSRICMMAITFRRLFYVSAARNNLPLDS